MPIAFNPPPLPSPDTAKLAAKDNASDASAPPAGAFSQALAAAGARNTAESKTQRPADSAEGEVERHNRARIDTSEIAADVAAWLAPTATMSSTPAQANDEPSDADPRAPRAPQRAGAHAQDAVTVTAPMFADKPRIDRPLTNTDVRPVAEPQRPVRSIADAISPAVRDADDARHSTVARPVSPAIENAQPGTPSIVSTHELIEGSKPLPQTKVDAIAEPSVSLQAAANVSALTTAHETRQIETAVGTGGWQDEFTQSLAHVVVLGSDNVQFRMHPAELGPVDIAINVASDHASLLITATHQATRDALEQALPQLRDMLANQGITLGQATVQGDGRDAQAFAEWRANMGAAERGGNATVGADEGLIVRLDRLIDVFA